MKYLILLMAMADPAAAQDVLILGEVHDNPAHHAEQATQVAALRPSAIVFEMLTADQAAAVTDENRMSSDRLEQILGWADSGWPDFDMYYPIFSSAPRARIYGAQVSRAQSRRALAEGVATVFGRAAVRYGLTKALPTDQQAAREALQRGAHCDALPAEMLPSMVDVQRLRDAELARTTLQALADTGGPVAVITGNGHARKDWGVPAVLVSAAPGTEVLVIGQTEADRPLEGGYDLVLSAAAVERPDPCDAFR